MESLKELRLAVLIDADNIPHKCLKSIMEEIAVYGNATIKRVYGDWTRSELAGWKAKLLEHAIVPMQQYGYTSGKNSTDSLMIIDAMDILYSGRVDGFCLVSSDSDFTRLATRLREAGMKVIGFGEEKTPQPFIVACDKFIYIEVITNREKKQAKEDKPKQEKTSNVPKDVLKLVSDSVSDLADEEGWAFLGEVGNLLLKKQPSFDTRNFGYRNLTLFIMSLGSYEVDARETTSPHIKHMYVRAKKA